MITTRSFPVVSMVLVLLTVSPLHATDHEPCPFSSPGLVVETVDPESVGFRAGLMPGDRLFSWCRTLDGQKGCVARGELRTPFDWRDIELDDVQRGGVVLEGSRGAERLRWSLLPVVQGFSVAPLLLGSLAQAYEASWDREQAGDFASAGQEFERAAELASESLCIDEEIWLLDRAAQLRTKAKQWPEVDAGYQTAVAKAQELKTPRVEAHLHMDWWEAFWLRDEITQARQHLERALFLEEQNRSESLFVAWVLIRLGATADRQDNLDEAYRLNQRAYDLVRHAAPGSGREASTTNNLAAATAMRGDLAQAEIYLARTLAIQEKLSPSGQGIVMNLWNYGELLLNRGDLAGAEAVLLRAKKILEKIQPNSADFATTLHLLGAVADRRGDHD